MTLLAPRRTRAVITLALAGAILPLSTACGGGGEPPRWEPALTVSASPTPSTVPTPPSPSPTPTSAPSPSRSTRPAATTGAPARTPRSLAQRATVTVSLTAGLGQRTAAGLQQEGCGEPSRALVTIRVNRPRDVSAATVRYHVRTPVPFTGTRPARHLGGTGESWLGTLGPFRAEPQNAAGGPIAITAEVRFTDGSSRTARTTSRLQPCRR